eukprot:2882598-Alexandrium_andersonii.AAC.1
MSASLVGSEMCIRDRRRPPGRGLVGWRLMLLWASEWGLRITDHARIAGCLLYTSDAADDM